MNRLTVESIVAQSAARASLTLSQRTELANWMSRWMPAFLTEREYTSRAIETMSRNAAAHYKEGR